MISEVYDPLLYVGWDIGIKRDTTAIVAFYLNEHTDRYCLWGHRIFSPTKDKPVNMTQDVEPLIVNLLSNQRVAALMYDPYQAATTAQKLEDLGYGNQLIEVNQLTEMTEAANTLHGLIHAGRLQMYYDLDLRSHFAHANAQQTERGWRIVKQRQSLPIDAVVACAMALLGATRQSGRRLHMNYARSSDQMRSLLDLV